MAIKYGFFNSVNGDRKYNADDISNYFLKLISDGVFATPANAMQVQANSGMTVQVSAGWGFIQCKWINNSVPYLLTLDASDVVLNRIDRIVLRLNASSSVRTMSIAIKKGTAASSPVAPALTRVSGGIWELSLAQIYIGAGVTSISQSNITDERPNTSVCGYVTGLIDQIDTTDLFAQYNAAFNEWFASIKEDVKSTSIVVNYNSSHITTTTPETTININIPEYNSSLDILNVYINGLKLIENVDYINHDTYIQLTTPIDVIGTSVEFEALKSMDTEAPETIVSALQALQARVRTIENNYISTTTFNSHINNLTFKKISQAEFDAITVKDTNTIYYVYDDSGNITQYMGDAELTSGSGTIAGQMLGVIKGSMSATIAGNIEQGE